MPDTAAKSFLVQHAVPTGVTSTRWWWVRHAPVRSDGGNIYGQIDIECDCSDRHVFEGVAKFLPKNAVWYASGLQRTHQTARAIWDAGLTAPAELIKDKAFDEQHMGEWQGRNRAQFFASLPAEIGSYWFAPANERAPGGESFNDLCERVSDAVERISVEHAGKDIVAVAHGGTIKAAIAHALKLDPWSGLAFTIDNCSITRLDHLAAGEHIGWRVPMINQQPWVAGPSHEAMHQPAGPEVVNKLA